MVYLKNKIRRFNMIFSWEEKAVIILSSMVTIMSIILLWMGAILLFNKLIDATAIPFAKAVNALVGTLFEGWVWFKI